MANKNQYITFATGGGAFVLSNADYTALPARGTGFVEGVADPLQLNSVWRQASVVSAAFGQFCADYGPSDVLDDGSAANLEAQFRAALNNYVEALVNPTQAPPTTVTIPGADKGVVLTGNNYELAFGSLPEDDTPTVADTFAYMRSDGVHVKTTFGTIEAIIEAAVNAQPTPPIVPGDRYAAYNLPSQVALGNNQQATIPLTGFASPFGNGDASGFQFTKAGLYTIQFSITLTVSTNYSSGGGSAAVARAYSTFWAYLNGNQIILNTQASTADNYAAAMTTNASYTAYFAIGDKIVFKGSGTGDSYNSNGCFVTLPSYVNVTKIA